MSEEKPTYDVQRAQLILERERQARAERAAQRIQAVLDEERCQLIPTPGITADGRITATLQIVAQ